MKDSIPINLDVLVWSRESIGLSIEDVAKKIKKHPQIVKSWENGELSPTYVQLEKLAYAVYKRPVAIFFFPDIPEEENIKTQLRSLPDAIIEELPTQLIKLYRKAKVFQLNLEELYNGTKPVSKALIEQFSLSDENQISSISSSIRKVINISPEEQFSWQSYELAFKNWRRVLASHGIFIFKDAFRDVRYSGFCIYNDKYPIIYINNSMPITRQIFTIFHELGHLLIGLGGVDFRENSIPNQFSGEYYRYELICNRFASEFLVPDNYFKKENLKISEEYINSLSRKYFVSREVILRKYLNHKLIAKDYYKEMSEKWISEVRKGKKGGQYHYNQIAYLGESYINLVFSKYYRKEFSVDAVSKFLNIKVKSIPNFEHFAFK